MCVALQPVVPVTEREEDMGGYRLWAVVILVASCAALSCAKTSEGRRLFPWRAGGMEEDRGDMEAEGSGEALSSSTNHAAKRGA